MQGSATLLQAPNCVPGYSHIVCKGIQVAVACLEGIVARQEAVAVPAAPPKPPGLGVLEQQQLGWKARA